MMNLNKEAFDEFRIIHDEYALNPEKFQEEYNKAGSKIQVIIRKFEDMLCARSEGNGYGKYTSSLAEKFQNEVRREFPKIDSIGITTFSLKKITPK